MKSYQLDIFGNEVPISYIILSEKCDKKDRAKKDHRYIFQKCCLMKGSENFGISKKNKKAN